MFEVRLLGKALKQREELSGTRHETWVEAALDQLALNPRPNSYWDCEDDPDAKYIYAGPDREWMISYEIDDKDQIVYVFAIDIRPSIGFDPR